MSVLLRWTVVEAYSSWHTATGKAGSYAITYQSSDRPFFLSFPGGTSGKFETLEGAKEAAEGYEEAFIAGMKPTIGKFWMVHGLGQREPRYKHYTAESASAEAKRLAGVYPTVTFVVLEVVDAYCAPAPTINQFEVGPAVGGKHYDDDLPF